jgi:hypothetical protein
MDDGQTWQPITSFTATNQALVLANAATGFVSLRMTVTDTSGNSATSTVIRAYQVIP